MRDTGVVPEGSVAFGSAQRKALKFAARLYFALVRGWICALALAWGGWGGSAERVPEYSVKALFLYNFIKFTEWPQLGSREVVLCLAGPDPFGEALDAIDGRTAHGSRVRVRRDVKIEEAKECHLLFVNEPDRPRLLRIFRQLEGTSVLTVGETEGFAGSGGMIELQIEDNRVQFEVNIKTVQRGHIKISAQLLKLARKVLE